MAGCPFVIRDVLCPCMNKITRGRGRNTRLVATMPPVHSCGVGLRPGPPSRPGVALSRCRPSFSRSRCLISSFPLGPLSAFGLGPRSPWQKASPPGMTDHTFLNLPSLKNSKSSRVTDLESALTNIVRLVPQFSPRFRPQGQKALWSGREGFEGGGVFCSLIGFRFRVPTKSV